jgi:hypothetical protein
MQFIYLSSRAVTIKSIMMIGFSSKLQPGTSKIYSRNAITLQHAFEICMYMIIYLLLII